MATPQELLDFRRRAGGTTPTSILEMPKLSQFLSSTNPDRQKQYEALDVALDKWRKSLVFPDATTQAIAEVNGTISAAQTAAIIAELKKSLIAGPAGPQGPAGKDGKDGSPGTDGADLNTVGILRHIWIAFRTDQVAGTGTQSNPFDGSTADKLDAILMAQPAYTDIHIGPGLYETRGGRDGAQTNGWYMKTGQRIQGAGIDLTVFKLIDCNVVGQFFPVITNTRYLIQSSADQNEVSDLTIDFNLDALAVIGIGGVTLYGDYCTVRRVRLFGWGGRGGHESFPVLCGGSHSLIENILMDAPDEVSQGANTTCIFGGSAGEDPRTGIGQFSHHATIRNCIIDGMLLDGVTSCQSTGLSCDGRGVILVENNVLANMRNGGPYKDSWNSDSLIVRGNRYYNVKLGLSLNLGNGFTIGREYDDAWRPYITIATISSAISTATVTTTTPHGFATNDWVDIQGTTPPAAGYNKLVKITVVSPTVFTFAVSVVYSATTGGNVTKVPAVAVTSITNLGGGYGEVTVGANHGVLVGGRIQIGGVTGADAAIYNVEYALVYFVTATSFTIGWSGVPVSSPPAGSFIWWNRSGVPAKSVAVSGSNVMTVETYYPNDLTVGQQMGIQGVRGAAGANYNGYFKILSIVDPTHFTIQLPGAVSGSTADLRYEKKWTLKRLLVEDNSYDLTPDPVNYSIAITAGIYPLTSVPTICVTPEVIIRRNVIRFKDGLVPAGTVGFGIGLDHAGALILEDNIIDIPSVGHFWDPCFAVWPQGNVFARNNKTINGVTIRTFDWMNVKYLNDIDTSIKSMLLLQMAGI